MSDSIFSRAFEDYDARDHERRIERVRVALGRGREEGLPGSLDAELSDTVSELIQRLNRVRERFGIEAGPELLKIAEMGAPEQAVV